MKNRKIYMCITLAFITLISVNVNATTNQVSFAEEIKAGKFPNYFSLFDLKEVQVDIEKSMTSILNRVALPYEEHNKIQTTGFMQKVREYAETTIYISGGVVRTLLGYIYKKLHNQALRFIEGEPKDFSNETLKKELSDVFQRMIEGNRRNNKKKEPINPLKVMGVGSDIDFLVDTEEKNNKLTNFINSAEHFLKLRDDKSIIKHSVMPIADVKNYTKQLGEGKDSAVAQGGSSLDWMAFSLETNEQTGSFRFPKAHENILDDFLKGQIKYYPKTLNTRDFDKQVIRGLRPLFEIPFLQFEENSLEIVCNELKEITELSFKANEQVTKLLRNARFCCGNNRLFKGQTQTDTKIWEILKEKKNIISIPLYAHYKPLLPVNDNKKSLMDIGDFKREFTDNGYLYHGTKELQNYIFMLRNGPVRSINTEEFYNKMWSQGVAVFGSGTYMAPRKSITESYAGENGITLSFKLKEDKNLKILKITEKEDNKDYINRDFDIIINEYVLIQNYRCLKLNSSMKSLIETQIQDTKNDLKNTINKKFSIYGNLLNKICLHLNPGNGYSVLLESNESDDENIKLLIKATQFLDLENHRDGKKLFRVIFDYLTDGDSQNKINSYKNLLLESLKLEKYNSLESWARILSAAVGKEAIFNLLSEEFPNILSQKDNNENSLLHIAVSLDEKEFANFLVQKDKKSLGIKNKNGKTPFDIAFDKKYFDLAKTLVEQDEGIIRYQQQDQHGDTFLHRALSNNQVDLAKALVQKDKKCLGIKNTQYLTPLNLLFDSKNFDLAKEFVEQAEEGSIDYQTQNDYYKSTFLHMAIDADQIELAKALFQKEKKFLKIEDKNGNTPLDVALDKNHFDLAKEFIKNDNGFINYEKRNYSQSTLLHRVVDMGQEELAKAIFMKKQDCINSINKYCESPVSLAIDRGLCDLAQWFIENENNIINYKQTFKGMNTLLHKAVSEGKEGENLAKAIFAKDKTCLSMTNSPERQTPLQLALHNRNYELAEWFILNAEDKEVFNIIDNCQGTPLSYVCSSDKENLLNIILDKGGVNLLTNPCRNDESVPLHIALLNNHRKIAEILFEKNKASIGKTNKNNETPLHVAIKNDFLELSIKFIKQGKEFINFKQEDWRGNTPLHLAISKKELNSKQNELITLFFEEAKEALYIKNSNNKSVVDLGVENGHFDHVYNFIKYDENIINFKKIYSNGNTLFHLALSTKHKDLCELLFCEKRKETLVQIINQQNESGKTLLHHACLNNSEAAEFLIKIEGINLTLQNKQGYTALHFAVMDENESLIKALVEKSGVLLNIKAHPYERLFSYNPTPLELAKEYNNQTIVQLLIELEKEAKNEKK